MRKEVKPKPSAAAKQKVRRARVAVALSEGATVDAIARAENVTPKTVLADARSPEVRVLIDRMVDKYAERMEVTFKTCLDVIDAALGANRVIVLNLGQGMQEKADGGPDFYARLTAVRSFKDFCLANRPTPKEDTQRKAGVWTLDELREMQAILTGGTHEDAKH